MKFLSTVSYQMWRVKSRFWYIVLPGKKKGITFLILFFLLCCGYIKNVILICVYKNRHRIYHIICGCSSLMTNMQIIGSIVCWLSPVSEKKKAAFPFALVRVKKRLRLFVHVEHDEKLRIGRKSNFITNRMMKMSCTNAHFRAEWRKCDPFFVWGDIFAHGTWNPHFWSK